MLHRRTWALRGLHKVWNRHDRLSRHHPAERLGVYFKLYAHNITTPDVVAFVAYLLRMVPRKVILIWDQLD